MKAATLLILIGVAACGGKIGGDTVNTGSGHESSGGSIGIDSGSGSGSRLQGTGTGSASSLSDKDASAPTCNVPQSGCVLCSEAWHCDTGVFPPCPANVDQNISCDINASPECFYCAGVGISHTWVCMGIWVDDAQSLSCTQ